MPSALSLYQARLSELRSQVLLQKFRQPCRCAARRRITSFLELETVTLANIDRPAAIEADLSLFNWMPRHPLAEVTACESSRVWRSALHDRYPRQSAQDQRRKRGNILLRHSS